MIPTNQRKGVGGGTGGNARFAGIYGIIDAGLVGEPVAFGAMLLSAGIRVLQYRAKGGVDRSVLAALLGRTRAAGALLIVNDDLDAALAADGWHGGQEDLALHDRGALRARLGTRVFGISAASPAEARAAQSAGADYLGVGPFAPTHTKADAGPAIGAAGVRAVVAATRLPVVAIGGIGLHNLTEVVSCGAAMAAVISALARAPDPAATARALIAAWRGGSA